MTHGVAHQLAALQRIAVYSAAVRGHELGAWHTLEICSVARCIRCRAETRVYFPAFQPEVEGTAIERLCAPQTAGVKVA